MLFRIKIGGSEVQKRALLAGLLFALFLLPRPAAAQSALDSLPPVDSLSDAVVNAWAQGLVVEARRFEAIFLEKNGEAAAARAAAEATLNAAKQDSTATKGQLDSLAQLLKTTKNLEKVTVRQREQAEKTSAFAQKTADSDSLNRRKTLRKTWQQVRALNALLAPPPPLENDTPAAAATEKASKKKEKKRKEPAENEAIVASSQTAAPTDQAAAPLDSAAVSSPKNKKNPSPKPAAAPSPPIKKYDPAADVMLYPPTPPCVLAASSRDEFSGEISREMARAELFRYTNPALKTYLQGKTHVVCEAALATAGPNASLLLTFRINDPNARKAFGRLEKNSSATLTFLDGTTLTLQNARADDGTFDPETQAATYRAQYPLPPDALKKIRRTELDKIRIAWSNGYDDYDVQQINLLLRQAECLFK
jgi:hypothetical protein